jgi:hypothetical protein
MPRKELVDLTLVWRHETEKAIAVSLDESGEWIWLPKQAIEYEQKKHGRLVDVTLEAPLAETKGLV